ncbi:right-handed parallel beta-helix repeat-containing protein [Falsiroseomonas sp. CW058]|uniref:right-handed parallel beta-helix repeat-containing protein n=1 Tax=Falsiroseomonas sp. CW058 TaxID=3388664 RepID=UPI003D31905D
MSATLAAVTATLRFERDAGRLRPRYWRGESLRVLADFADQVAATPAAVAGVEFRLRKPDGTVLVLSGAAVGGAAATWWVDVGLDQAGAWAVRVSCAGPTEAVDERVFDCVASAVVPADGAPPWVDAGSGALITPSGQPVTAQRIDNLPALGAPLEEDLLPVVRGGQGGRVSWQGLRDAAAAARQDDLAPLLPVANIIRDGEFTAAGFGAVPDGTTDNAAALQLLLTRGAGREVRIRRTAAGSIYRLAAGLVVPPRTRVIIDGGVALDFGPAAANVTGLLVAGSAGGAVALTGDAVRGTMTIAVADGAAIPPGALLRIWSTDLFDPGRTNSRLGEMVRVGGVTGNMVTLQSALWDTYRLAAAAMVEVVTPSTGVVIEGGQIWGPTTPPGDAAAAIRFYRAQDVTVRGVEIARFDAVHIQFRDTISGVAEHCTTLDTVTATTGYGVSFSDAAQHCRAHHMTSRNCRHAVTTGNSAAYGGIPRDCEYAFSDVENSARANYGAGGGGDALDTHAAAERINFRHVTVRGATLQAVNFECASGVIEHVRVIGADSHGIGVHNETGRPGDIRILNCEVEAVGLAASGVGIRVAVGNASAAGYDRVDIIGNRVRDFNAQGLFVQGDAARAIAGGRIEGNRVDARGRSVAADAVWIRDARNLRVGGNTVITNGTAQHAIRLRDTAAPRIRDNAVHLPAGATGTAIWLNATAPGLVDGAQASGNGVTADGPTSAVGIRLDDGVGNARIAADNDLRGCATPYVRGANASNRVAADTRRTATIVGGTVAAWPDTRDLVVDTEGGAASDDLDTVTGLEDGQELRISAANPARTVNLRDASVSGGNIRTLRAVTQPLAATLSAARFVARGGEVVMTGGAYYGADDAAAPLQSATPAVLDSSRQVANTEWVTARMVALMDGILGGRSVLLRPNLLSGLAFARATAGNRVSAAGVVEGIAPNLPRWDGPAGEMALDGARTNELLHSGDFGQAAWTKVGVAAIAAWGGGTAPDGTATAQTLGGTGASTSLAVGQSRAKPAAPMWLSCSVFTRGAAGLYLHLWADAGTNGNGGRAVVDLGAMAIVSTAVFGSFTGIEAGIEATGNGWWRPWLTVTSGSETTHRHYALLSNSPATVTWSPAGVAVPVWGAQLERARGPSAYVATGAAAATRAAEGLSGALAVLWPAGEGTVLASLRLPFPAGAADRVLMQLDDGGNGNRLIVRNPAGTGNIRLSTVTAGGAVADVTTLGTVTRGRQAIALALKGGRAVVQLQGGAPASVAALAFTPTTLRLGNDAGLGAGADARVLGIDRLGYAAADDLLAGFMSPLLMP